MKNTLIIAIVFLTGLCAQAADTNAPVNLPGITIHGGNDKYVEAEGSVCQTNGILEFIAVEPGGRDYESIFTLKCRPSSLKFALLLIGCEPDETDGTRLAISAQWTQNGKPHQQPIEKFLIDRNTTNSPPATLPWIFTGSGFATNPITGKQVFQSDEEQAFIALWQQPSILINLAASHGNPYRGEDQGFEINSATLPPKDTPIKLIFRPRTK
jgi:hypothetical protein